MLLHSRKLTWKPKKGPIKTTALLKGDYMGFHVRLGECKDSGFFLALVAFQWHTHEGSLSRARI